MPRLSRELVKTRETLTISLAREGKSVDQIQLALMTHGGGKMNPYRLQELMQLAKTDTANILTVDASPVPITPPVTLTPPPEFSKSILDRPVAVIDEAGPFYTIPELIRRINAGEYNNTIPLSDNS